MPAIAWNNSVGFAPAPLPNVVPTATSSEPPRHYGRFAYAQVAGGESVTYIYPMDAPRSPRDSLRRPLAVGGLVSVVAIAGAMVSAAYGLITASAPAMFTSAAFAAALWLTLLLSRRLLNKHGRHH
jgi:hypothetical protein